MSTTWAMDQSWHEYLDIFDTNQITVVLQTLLLRNISYCFAPHRMWLWL